jgi:CHAT domain-containing protein/tetratricopeptide (TPR) repeat protein
VSAPLRTLIFCELLVVACTRDQTPVQHAHARTEARAVANISDPTSLAAALAVPPESLRAAGEERYGRQSYDSAQEIWRVEVKRARNAGDTAAEARARMWLGLAAWRLGDYATARSEGETALAMKQRMRLDGEVSRSFNALGLLAWNEGRHGDALRLFDSAITAAKRNHDPAGVARAAANVPLVQVELGDFDAARRGLDAALAAGAAVHDDRTQGNAFANMAMLEIRLGDPRHAISMLTKARAHYAAIDYTTGEANALGQLATAWSSLGELQRAFVLADSALAIARAKGLQQEVASELEVIADLHEQAGSPRLALQRLLDADHLDSALGLVVERATNLRRVAALLYEMGEVDASVSRARQALAGHVASNANGEAIYDRLQLAMSLSLAGDARGARAEADSAGHFAVLVANPAAIRNAAAVAAQLALDDREPRRALALLDAVDRDESSTDWKFADLRAEAWFSLERFEKAQHDGERAIAALERTRASLGIGPLRSGFLANRVAPYSHLVSILLARGDTASAFRVAASLPGRGISERLGAYGGAAPAIASVADGERLLLRIAALEQQIADMDVKAQGSEQYAALARTLAATRTAYEEQLAHRAPSPDANLLGITAVDVHDVQSRLASDQALLTFLVGPDHLDIFVVTKTATVARRVGVSEQALAGRVRVARELLEAGGSGSDVLTAMGELHDLLFGPALASGALDRVTRLLIVPHGALVALPFAALWNRKAAHFLVEDRVISYLPAVAALTVVGQQSRSSLTRGMMVFAPLSDSLPGSGREARAIGKMLPDARVQLGAGSSEAGVRAALDAGRPIHIASHGVYNAQDPLFSRMTVGPVHQNGTIDDGRLEIHEILELRTRSPLVFLSGCETGLGVGSGPFAQSIDQGSLAQAFLVAGAGSVVATLWRVDDFDAVSVATRFYEQLGTGASPEYALAQAQRNAIHTRTANLTWGAYAVSGLSSANPATVSVKGGRNP